MNLNLVNGAICAFLTGLGTLGNISVSVIYKLSLGGGPEQKSVYLILTHLAFTNIIMLLAKGVPRTIAAVGLRNFLDDIGCKSVIFMDRVARGLSISTSSLLAVVQAITISPRDSELRKLKLWSAHHMHLVLLLLWLLNAMISLNLLRSIRSASLNKTQVSNRTDYCSFQPESQIMKWTFLFLMTLRDSVFQGVMGGASGYMVLLLHKHHQHVVHLRNSKLLSKTPPELRAAQSVLLLMLCFLFFYLAEYGFSLFLSLSLEKNSTMFNIREFLTLGYAIFSPFVLIHRNRPLAECWRVHWRRKTLRKCLFPLPS